MKKEDLKMKCFTQLLALRLGYFMRARKVGLRSFSSIILSVAVVMTSNSARSDEIDTSKTATYAGITWAYHYATYGNWSGYLLGSSKYHEFTSYGPSISATTSGEITLPSSLGGFSITGIDRDAFKGCSKLKRIIIPSGIKRIRDLAFPGCNDLRVIVFKGNAPTATKDAFSGYYAAAEETSYSGVYDTATIYVYPSSSGWGVTIPGKWKEVSIAYLKSVNFDANGGSVSADTRWLVDGDKVGSLPTPTRANATFNGWYTAKNGGTKISANTTVSQNTTYYAQWAMNQYSVKFNANGGSGEMANQAFVYGMSQNLSANAFTRTGYTFQGWATSAGGAKVYDDQQSVNNLTTTANGTVNLYAVWVGCQYAVKFNANGGIGTMVDQPFSFWVSQDLSSNAFSRVGYAFDGWATSADGTKVYSDRQCVYNLTETAGEIVNLYATWMPQTSAAITARPRYPWNGKVDVDATIGGNELRQYLVSVEAKDLDGGTNLPMSIDQSLVNPGKHRFTWEADADITGDCELTNVAVSVNVDDGLLVSAKKVLSLEVTGYTGTETLTNVPVLVRLSEAIGGFRYNDFADANGGDLIFTDESGSEAYPYEIDEWHVGGESLVWVKLPTMTNGTRFKAAYGNSQLTTLNSQFSSHDVWSGYAGVWHMNEDSGTAYDSSVFGLNALPTKGDNEFADTSEMIAYEGGACGRARVNCSTMPTSANNWMTYGNFMLVPTYDSMMLGSTFVASVWIKGRVIKNYPRILSRKNVIEDLGGFELSINDYGECDVRGGTSVTTSGINMPPYSNEWIQVAFSIDGDVVNCYTNGVFSGNSSGKIASTYDNGFPLGIGNKPNGSNPSFFGQYDEIRLRGGSLSADRIKADYDMIMNRSFINCGTVEDGKGLEVLGEFPYSVRFDANGGTGTMADESFTYGTAKALTANEFTCVGNTFQGWATSGDGAAIYSDGQSVSNLTITVDDVVDLYAVWSVNNYSVKFNANGGTGTMADESFTYGTAKALTANAFTRTGYTFQGWATSASGTKIYNDKQSVSNLTETSGAVVNLYAVWDHGKVQLWAGGPYWATTNIGATKPEEYGYYFWWGDTIGYKRENNKWVASDGSSSNFSFYDKSTCNQYHTTLRNNGWTTSGDVLTPEHDAARVHWGGGWRMPTFKEFKNLIDKCDWTWSTVNGIKGYIVRGRSDYASANIFLPAAGFTYEKTYVGAGANGYYWSSVPNCDGYSTLGYGTSCRLTFSLSSHSYSTSGYTDYNSDNCSQRYYGLSVRPVQNAK